MYIVYIVRMIIYMVDLKGVEGGIENKAKGNAESSVKQNSTSLLENQQSSINGFVSKLANAIIQLMYRLLDLLLLIFLIFIVNICNDYILDVLWQFFCKFMCIGIIIFIRVKVMGIIYEYMLNTDRRKLIFISGLIFILDVICLLSVYNAIDEFAISIDRLIICLTIPLLIMNIAIVMNPQSMIPLIIIILAFIAGIVVFTLSFFVDFGLWKSPLEIASIVYIILGLLCIIQLLLYYLLNKSKSSSANDISDMKGDAVGKLNEVKGDATGKFNDVKGDVSDKLKDI
jgi:hypothetical protein